MSLTALAHGVHSSQQLSIDRVLCILPVLLLYSRGRARGALIEIYRRMDVLLAYSLIIRQGSSSMQWTLILKAMRCC